MEALDGIFDRPEHVVNGTGSIPAKQRVPEKGYKTTSSELRLKLRHATFEHRGGMISNLSKSQTGKLPKFVCSPPSELMHAKMAPTAMNYAGDEKISVWGKKLVKNSDSNRSITGAGPSE